MSKEGADSSCESAVEATFSSLRARTADIQIRSAKLTTSGNLGCALMVLPVAFGIWFLVQLQKPGFADLSWFGWPLVALFVGILAVVTAGFRLWRRWAVHSATLCQETDEKVIPPLVETLLPEARFSRPVTIRSGWHPSLLLPYTSGALATSDGRLDGHMLGQPISIVEGRGSFNLDVPEGWTVEVELPFFVGGHLRLRVVNALSPGKRWSAGFETCAEDSELLGSSFTVDVAPLGTGTNAGEQASPEGFVPPARLLTTALYERLRSRPDVAVGVTSNRLWLVIPRQIRAFESRIASLEDLESWKKAAAAMRDIEVVTREILAAGHS